MRAGAGACDWLNAVTRSGTYGSDGQRRQPRPGEHDAEVRARFVHVHARLLAERRRRRVREPVDQPSLTEVVVDHQQPVRLEMIPHGPERLRREHVALEPHAREARLHGQRIDQREHHQVVLLRRRPQVVPGIVVDERDARVRVQADRDVARARGVRIAGSISTASTCFAPWRSAAATSVPEPAPRISTSSNESPKTCVRPLVEVFLLLDRRHRLVEDVVHLHHGVGAVVCRR